MSLGLIINSPALKIAGAVLVPNIAGYLNGALVTRPNLPWHQTLTKPPGNPPAWLFAPVWTSLYAAMGYASYLVWRDGSAGLVSRSAWQTALGVYGVQLVLNQLWTPLFFGKHDLHLVSMAYMHRDYATRFQPIRVHLSARSRSI